MELTKVFYLQKSLSLMKVLSILSDNKIISTKFLQEVVQEFQNGEMEKLRQVILKIDGDREWVHIAKELQTYIITK